MKRFKKPMAVLITAVMTMAAFAEPAMAESLQDMTYTAPSGYTDSYYDSEYTQQHYQYEDDIGKGVVETVVKHQDDESQHNTRAYPDNLHA